MSTNGQERWEKKALKTTLKKRDESCKHKVKNGSKYVCEKRLCGGRCGGEYEDKELARDIKET